jgi:predicted  nucleic acid-binding Zn-ribbon protein
MNPGDCPKCGTIWDNILYQYIPTETHETELRDAKGKRTNKIRRVTIGEKMKRICPTCGFFWFQNVLTSDRSLAYKEEIIDL